MCPPKAMDGEGDDIALMTFFPLIIYEDLVPQAWPSVMESGGSSCVASPCPRSETLAWGGRGWRIGSKRRADTWWTASLALKVCFQVILKMIWMSYLKKSPTAAWLLMPSIRSFDWLKWIVLETLLALRYY